MKKLWFALFFLTFFSTVSALTNISMCGADLNIDNEYYATTMRLGSSNTCLTVSAENVTLDCGYYGTNYAIDGDDTAGSYGILATAIPAPDNFVLKNCWIHDYETGLGYDADNGSVSDVVFESNKYGLRIFRDDFNISNSTFTDNWFTVAEISGGSTGNWFTNCTGFLPANVSWGAGTNDLNVSWFVKIQTLDAMGIYVDNVYVNVSDSNGLNVFNGVTNETGWIDYVELRGFSGNNSVNTSFSPHVFNASKSGYSNSSESINVTESGDVFLVLPSFLESDYVFSSANGVKHTRIQAIVSAAYDVNYWNGSEWRPNNLSIVDTLESGYQKENKKHKMKKFFRNTTGNTGFKLRVEGENIVFKYKKIVYNKNDGKEGTWKTIQDTNYSVEDSVINYTQPYTNVSVLLGLTHGKMFEEIWLNENVSELTDANPDGNVTFRATLSWSTDLKPCLKGTDICFYSGDSFITTAPIEIRNSTNDTLFIIEPPYAVDSNASCSPCGLCNPVRFAFNATMETSTKLMLNKLVPFSWLNDTNRVYPVKIEPSFGAISSTYTTCWTYTGNCAGAGSEEASSGCSMYFDVPSCTGCTTTNVYVSAALSMDRNAAAHTTKWWFEHREYSSHTGDFCTATRAGYTIGIPVINYGSNSSYYLLANCTGTCGNYGYECCDGIIGGVCTSDSGACGVAIATGQITVYYTQLTYGSPQQVGNASIGDFVFWNGSVETGGYSGNCNYTLMSTSREQGGQFNVFNESSGANLTSYSNGSYWINFTCSDPDNFTVQWETPAPTESNWTQNTTVTSNLSMQYILNTISNNGGLDIQNVSGFSACPTNFACNMSNVDNLTANSNYNKTGEGDELDDYYTWQQDNSTQATQSLQYFNTTNSWAYNNGSIALTSVNVSIPSDDATWTCSDCTWLKDFVVGANQSYTASASGDSIVNESTSGNLGNTVLGENTYRYSSASNVSFPIYLVETIVVTSTRMGARAAFVCEGTTSFCDVTNLSKWTQVNYSIVGEYSTKLNVTYSSDRCAAVTGASIGGGGGGGGNGNGEPPEPSPSPEPSPTPTPSPPPIEGEECTEGINVFCAGNVVWCDCVGGYYVCPRCGTGEMIGGGGYSEEEVEVIGASSRLFNVTFTPDHIKDQLPLYSPKSYSILVKNLGEEKVFITNTPSEDWVDVTPATFELGAGEEYTVNVRVTATQNNAYSKISFQLLAAEDELKEDVDFPILINLKKIAVEAGWGAFFKGTLVIWLLIGVVLVITGIALYTQKYEKVGLGFIGLGLALVIGSILLFVL